ncbi:MAG: hypothetical protein LBG45_05675, partial [Dysgonamonadaceae bacterium]|nr:hypothetical protein [Dysgonamonadaceae bacterium]
IRDNRLPTGSFPFEFYVFIKFYPRKVTPFFIFLSKCKSKVRDAGLRRERYFLPNFASLRDAGSPFTTNH